MSRNGKAAAQGDRGDVLTKPRIRLKHAAPVATAGISGVAHQAADPGGNEAMVNWHPSLRPAQSEISYERDAIVARSRDMDRNNGWVAGAITRETDAVIGARFRPLMKPNFRALGLDHKWAMDFKAQVEALWQADAEDPRFYQDATRSGSISSLFSTAYRAYLLDGEALGKIQWRPDRPVKTVLRLIDTDLLSSPDDRADHRYLRDGVETDRHGAARAYHFRQAHQGDMHAGTAAHSWMRVRRETHWGRPIVLHFFDKRRDGQTRGVSRLAPIMEKLKMEDTYHRVELQAAVINAVLAAFVRSPMDPESIADMLSDGAPGGGGGAWEQYNRQRGEYYEKKDGVRMAGARLTHLYPGEEIGTIPTARPAAQFADFESAVLRNIAAGIGSSYEQLAQDWSNTNYSSARAAMVEIWRGWTARRVSFAQGFCQSYLMAWLEEKLDEGLLPLPRNAPDFRDHWASYARAKWIGPGKGFVDPVKEVQAAAMRIALGLSTLEDEAAELTGADFTENLAQIKHEIAMMPEGSLHPFQESFAKLISGAPADNRDEPEQRRA